MNKEVVQKKDLAKSYLSIRISDKSKATIDKICFNESRKVVDACQVMLDEYAPIKLLLTKPLSLPREFSIGAIPISIRPFEESVLIDIGEQSIRLDKAEIKNINTLISNLILFTNSI